MFKRREKKIKAVFKMHFQATQVPKIKSKGIMISLIPVDFGKPTVKLAKASIVEGTCTWEKPVYETVKLVQEIKTGKIREKFYYLILSTGSSKSGFLGEVSIDFADLAEATKPMKLTLPLQTSKSGAILHVTVQRIQEYPDSRSGSKDESLMADLYEECLDTEAKDCYDIGRRNTQSPESGESSEAARNEDNEVVRDSESDNNGTKSREGMVKTPLDKLVKLTDQMKILERKAQVSEMEVESLRQQIIKEGEKGQKFTEQIANLKQERDALKAECEILKSSQKCRSKEEKSSPAPTVNKTMRNSLEDINQELEREKTLNRKMKLQLQDTEDSNSELVIALRDLNLKLEQKDTKITGLLGEIKALHSAPKAIARVPRESIDRIDDMSKSLGDIDEIEMLKQSIEDLSFELEVHRKEKNDVQMEVKRLALDYESLEIENKYMDSTLLKNQKEKIEMQQNYTESLAQVNQLELQVTSLEEEVKRQELQYSESLNVIDELDTRVENLQKEMENQAQVFQEDIDKANQERIEHEQRATRAEEAFRKIRWSNTNAAVRLQEKFKKLTAEMSLKIEENEKLGQRSTAEANDLRTKNELLEELLHKAQEEYKVKHEESERILHEVQEQNKVMWMKAKDDQEREAALVRKEVEKLMQENSLLKSETDQFKLKKEKLNLELNMLREEISEMKTNLLQAEKEKAKLMKEQPKFQGGLHKEKEQERAAPENSVRSPCKENKNTKSTEAERSMETNIFRTNLTDQDTAPATDINDREVEARSSKGPEDRPGTTKHDTAERKSETTPQLMLVEKNGHSSGEWDVSNLLSEVSSLKERNESMEKGLKEMHARYSEISLKFAEVEGERQQLVMALRNLKNGKKN